MKLNGGWLAPVLALASLTLSSAAPCRTEDPCEGGPASGPWRLPILTLGMGAANGRLHDMTTDKTVYRLRAVLIDVPTPNLSNLQGTITGSLDDGSEGDPEFLVAGTYSGTLPGGTGRFQLRVSKPGGEATIGFIDGSFEDAPGDESAGTFAAQWRLCR